MSSHQRLIHDCAHYTALDILHIISPCLRPEEHKDAYLEFLAVIAKRLAEFEEKVERQEKRIHPRPARGDCP
jgi:hypothetical protein